MADHEPAKHKTKKKITNSDNMLNNEYNSHVQTTKQNKKNNKSLYYLMNAAGITNGALWRYMHYILGYCKLFTIINGQPMLQILSESSRLFKPYCFTNRNKKEKKMQKKTTNKINIL